MDNDSIQSFEMTQEDFVLIKNSTKIQICYFANRKEDIGIILSKSQWDYWKSEYDWDEVEKIEIIENRTIEIENLRLKEKKN